MPEDFDLLDWKNSALLKEAAEHLLNQPEYIPMNPAAKAEISKFGFALRRELRKAKDMFNAGDHSAINDFCNKYGFDITLVDNCRFGVNVYGYRFVIILDLNVGVSPMCSEEILFQGVE